MKISFWVYAVYSRVILACWCTQLLANIILLSSKKKTTTPSSDHTGRLHHPPTTRPRKCLSPWAHSPWWYSLLPRYTPLCEEVSQTATTIPTTARPPSTPHPPSGHHPSKKALTLTTRSSSYTICIASTYACQHVSLPHPHQSRRARACESSAGGRAIRRGDMRENWLECSDVGWPHILERCVRQRAEESFLFVILDIRKIWGFFCKKKLLTNNCIF